MNLTKIVRRKKRVGRGIGSKGAKSGRGMKGQYARAGSRNRRGFEGGQTPLYQRLPKDRGSKQVFASQAEAPFTITARLLNTFADSSIVGPGQLRSGGFIRRDQRIKLIGGGKLTKKVTVRAHAATAGAIRAVEQAGGKVEIIQRDA